MPVILTIWELRLGISWFKASLITVLIDRVFKITKANWTGSVTQAVECLLCKHKALHSNPTPTKKEKKKNKTKAKTTKLF
jgi:hypothetical protein